MQDFLKQTIQEAGAIAKGYFDNGVKSIKTKSTVGDLVTEADVAVSDFIVKKIQDAYPEHTIFSEEVGEKINEGGTYEWVIDPIDGTRNFANGIPFWCTIIAVVRNGETWLGAVYNAISGDLFFAEKRKGAFLNDTKLSVNNTQSIDQAFGVMVQANKAGTYGDHIERFRVLAINLNTKTDSWVHNYGTMLTVCHLASGAVDFQAGNAGLDWDYLAPFLIAEEAGAIVTNGYGEPWTRGRQDYVMANTDLHPKVMQLFETYT
ncbi:MAG: hypothetical protein CO030_01135 [Candidatus Magasanikbacteria bacterium CG_4_9_14_0_2_um_filter_42_11]|uniref:Inositol monophosphatase n=1 Tax=Candidatus Magasanikbacteria bacterium CG_4_9_14_0_2_um_filter_42_11 TaxID=1974643 RepID=A0A2M8FAM5_9BACT|nr:MAG: hypothetical protein COU34_01235 [Candidatus Magasanikbacteria bacterium CG10_big_fil_rev_8_21_14_0_10_43_9]PIY92905.1 MAG: hypothetical protein COY70_00720 [Candidatus Magasanikbacteria bacterium CG_4_10_14_0_8_um_filter_42_12]PJC52767.1 MAG: hypothetical protein CO030_01135 [Candidatus Magasanikbacteria bacterium CG_4_9_14_0_2_um_filter_42_11]